MKLVNSKRYVASLVITKGQCMLCSDRLSFIFGHDFDGPEEPYANCCGFLYALTERKTENGAKHCTVSVSPAKKENKDVI
jgi:hypothetical protein